MARWKEREGARQIGREGRRTVAGWRRREGKRQTGRGGGKAAQYISTITDIKTQVN